MTRSQWQIISSESTLSGEFLPYYQAVDFMGSSVRVRSLKVEEMAHDMLVKVDAVCSQYRPRHPSDLKSSRTIAPLGKADIKARQGTFFPALGEMESGQLTHRDSLGHVGEHRLHELFGSNGYPKLMSCCRVFESNIKTSPCPAHHATKHRKPIVVETGVDIDQSPCMGQ